MLSFSLDCIKIGQKRRGLYQFVVAMLRSQSFDNYQMARSFVVFILFDVNVEC